GSVAWVLGFGSLLSFNVMSIVIILSGLNLFESMDYVTSNIMLPPGGLLIDIFAGWVMRETHIRKELDMKNFRLYLGWRVVLRIFVPLMMIIIFWNELFS